MRKRRRSIERQIQLVHIRPGQPMQNGQVESFHGKLRDEGLRGSWFGNVFEAGKKMVAWRGFVPKNCARLEHLLDRAAISDLRRGRSPESCVRKKNPALSAGGGERVAAPPRGPLPLAVPLGVRSCARAPMSSDGIYQHGIGGAPAECDR